MEGRKEGRDGERGKEKIGLQKGNYFLRVFNY